MIRHPAAPQDRSLLGLAVFDPLTAAAGVSGGASLVGGLLNASASKRAASIEARQAAASASALGQAGETAQNYLNPYVAGGTSEYQNLLSNGALWGNINNGYTDQAQGATNLADQLATNLATNGMSEGQLKQTPGYQFTLGQGLQATQNSAAARGLGVSGAALKGAATYATGLADNTYQNQFQNALSGINALGTVSNNLLQINSANQGNITNTFNRENTLAGYGANASGASASNALTAAGASNSAALSGASALAGGITGSTGALTGGLSNAANAYAGSQYLSYLKTLQGQNGMYSNNLSNGTAASSGANLGQWGPMVQAGVT